MADVVIDSRCVLSDEACERNLNRVLARKLPYCKVSPKRAGQLAIVASGPSVEDFLEEIRAFEHIWAINGAYNFLQDRGVLPTAFFGTDPLPGLAAYVQRPIRGTTFYLSAFCDEAVYDALKDYNVQVWFPQQDAVDFPGDLPADTELISGGTTALARAPFLARCLGFRDVTLYGADSSFGKGRYCYRDGTYPEDSAAPVHWVTINGEGPFPTETPLMQQVSQLGVMHTHQTWGVDFKIRCHGLMDAFIRAPLEADSGCLD